MFLPYSSNFSLRVTFSHHRIFALYSISSAASYCLFLRTSSLQSIFSIHFAYFLCSVFLSFIVLFFLRSIFSFNISSTSECLSVQIIFSFSVFFIIVILQSIFPLAWHLLAQIFFLYHFYLLQCVTLQRICFASIFTISIFHHKTTLSLYLWYPFVCLQFYSRYDYW